MSGNGLNIGEIDESDPVARAIADAEEQKGSPLTEREVDTIIKSFLPEAVDDIIIRQ